MKKSKYVCQTCHNISGNGRGAWGFCSNCMGKTWPIGCFARTEYDKKHPENKEIVYKEKF